LSPNSRGEPSVVNPIGYAAQNIDFIMRNTLICLCLAFPFCSHSQTPHPWEFGAGVGTSGYHGETNQLALGQQIYGLHPSYTIFLRKNISNHFAARFNVQYAELSGDDKLFTEPAWRQIRGISFSAPLLELSVRVEAYPFGLYQKKGRKTQKISDSRIPVAPYVLLGMGGTFSNAKVDWNDNETNEYLDPVLARVDKEYPQKLNFSIPMGLGVRFRISNRFTLGLEAIAHPTLNDYIDGISVAGDPRKNDWFASAQATASFAFGKDLQQHRASKRSADNSAKNMPAADRDEDGVPDEHDVCPDAPGPRNLLGCPDQDHDGIADKDDHCPTLTGLYATHGCPDMDGDGVADKDDTCPELKGVAAYRGCPAIDRDKDGVADAEDLCPDMPGKLIWKGCPDSDNDGLPDNKDGCPGIAGPDYLRGCPDTDKDGITDKEDECPTLPGTPELNGCPEALPPAPGVPFKAVYFGSTLKDWHNTSVVTLDEVVNILEADSTLFARLEGHTDDTGQEPANDLLAEHRAKKCLDYLASKGIEPKRLNYLGYGSDKPFVPNDSRKNRQLNRRVEVIFYRKK